MVMVMDYLCFCDSRFILVLLIKHCQRTFMIVIKRELIACSSLAYMAIKDVIIENKLLDEIEGFQAEKLLILHYKL
jgi:hypothetical protein